MTPARFLALLVLALALISASFWLSTQRYLPRDRSFATRVLPGLEPALGDVRGVRIVAPGGRTLATLDRPDGRWHVAERGYPADAARVRQLLRALADLRIESRRPGGPGDWIGLGVADAGVGVPGVRVEVRGLEAPVALIIGMSPDEAHTWVRLPGAAEALLAAPRLAVASDPRDWLARTVLDVPAERVQSLEVSRAGRPRWSMERTRRHAPIAAAAAALAPLAVDDVRRVDLSPPAGAESRATFRTFDGLVLMLTGVEDAHSRWLRIEAAYDAPLAARFPPGAGDRAPGPEQVRAEVERIGETTRDWWYEIPADRYDRVFAAPEDPRPPAPAPETP